MLTPIAVISARDSHTYMDDRIISWLLDNAGPVVRFRTIVDLLSTQDVQLVTDALDNLLTCQVVRVWLDRLRGGFNPDNVWSQRPAAFANVMGKLVQLGMRAGLQPFDTLTLPARAWLTDTIEKTDGPFRPTREMMVVVSFLALAGYSETKYVSGVLKRQLEFLFNRRPGIVADNSLAVSPTTTDLIGIAHAKGIMSDKELRAKAEAIVEDVIEGRTRITLPTSRTALARTLVLLETLPRFRTVRESKWFVETMAALGEWRTDRGTYRFPEDRVPERESGMWISGDFMALDDRNRESAMECESTFRVLWIQKIARSAA